MTRLRKDLLNPSLKKVLSSFHLDKNYVSGKGTILTDEKGRQYLDFISQYGAVPFGYNPDFLWEALDKVRQRSLPSLVQPSLPGEALKLANILAEVTPGDLCYCTFCQSGTEAVEASIKLARSTTGRELIISTRNSFHGKTLGALSATGKSSYQTPFRAPAPGFLQVPYNDAVALQEVFSAHPEEVAAFIVEPIQGEGGIIVAEPGYLQKARELCSEFGAVYIVDEIQTGLGRTGRLFACEYEGIEPDVLLLAKALGGGLLPLGVCISSPRVWNEDFGMLHSSTFANNNLTCAVGITVLEYLLADQQELILSVKKKGDYLREHLQRLQDTYPGVIKEVRGRGFMVGVEFESLRDCGSYDLAYMVDQGGFTALLAGYLLNVHQVRIAPFLNDSMTVRLEPSLEISCQEIDRVVEALEDIVRILYYRDYALLYRFLIDDYNRPEKINDYRYQTRNIKPSQLKPDEKAEHKFAFLIHYPAPEDMIANNPSFKSFGRDELYQIMEWQSQTDEPGLVCHMPAIRAASGSIAEGWLIGVPFGAREMMNLPRERTVPVLQQAVDMARELGAGIVGLGALTSVVTRGGRSVQGRNVAITSGNSFTVLMAMEALFTGAQKMNIDLETARGAVVGATGSIGRACALLLSERSRYITLLGNPEHKTSSLLRLNSLVQDMLDLAWKRLQEGQETGLSGWLKEIIQESGAMGNLMEKAESVGKAYDVEGLKAICHRLRKPFPIQFSLDIDTVLPGCDLVVAASSSPEYLIYSRHLQPGAVVCDVARPADVAPEVYRERDDVLILEGGLVQYPEAIAFGPNLGYRDGVNLACLSETVLLALEGDYRDYSIGTKLPLETLQYFRELAHRHGFGLAGLKMGDRELSEDEIIAIYQRSQQYRQGQSLNDTKVASK